MKYDEISFSGDCGRVSNEIETLIKPTHSCPKITKRSIPLPQKTMSIDQCILRMKVGNPCVRGCPIIEDLKKKES